MNRLSALIQKPMLSSIYDNLCKSRGSGYDNCLTAGAAYFCLINALEVVRNNTYSATVHTSVLLQEHTQEEMALV